MHTGPVNFEVEALSVRWLLHFNFLVSPVAVTSTGAVEDSAAATDAPAHTEELAWSLPLTVCARQPTDRVPFSKVLRFP